VQLSSTNCYAGSGNWFSAQKTGADIRNAAPLYVRMFRWAEENCAKGTNSQKLYPSQSLRFPFLL
jgi:hypothetical protein